MTRPDARAVWVDADSHRPAHLDDRPDETLASIARDLEAEARPDPSADSAELADVLTRERFRPQERQRCRSCGAPIVWATTGGRRAMPVDPDPIAGGNLQLARVGDGLEVTVVRPGDGTHRSHYVTCPHAENWRRTRRPS